LRCRRATATDRHRPLQASDSSDDFQPGPDRAFGGVLLCGGKAEQCHDAIAQELGDMAVVSADDPGTSPAVLFQQAVHVFGVKLARKGSRADQITEKHGDLAALDGGCLRPWGVRLRGTTSRVGVTRAQFCRGSNEPSAMTERKPQLLEVLLCQIWGDIEVNIVSREHFDVHFEAKTLQPKLNVGHSCPHVAWRGLIWVQPTIIAFQFGPPLRGRTIARL
jgi:hypothetical protein